MRHIVGSMRGGQALHVDDAPAASDEVLSAPALAFVGQLATEFAPALRVLLAARDQRPADGSGLGFLAETQAIRGGAWRCAEPRPDLTRRAVEITGPVERKMVINALNSGADVFMADFEDATAPTWENMVGGQVNLWDAVRGTIAYEDPVTGKRYALGARPATLMVRPRGLHLVERHVTQDGRPVPGCLFDFGLFFFHNAHALVSKGSGPYFYLPKLESHLEARWWNAVFVRSQELLGLPRGTIRATVLIETLPAAFRMDEILYELREHSAGLNCGRWDYIFSYIKSHRGCPLAVLPDRSQVGMTQPFLRAYSQLLIHTCHKRGVHAMGGMAAQVPIKSDPVASEAALASVRADKLREVTDGHDGTWVAHPGLVHAVREVWDGHMKGPHQLDRLRSDVLVARADLLASPSGTRTEAGLRLNVRVGIQYLEAWLRGIGCVPLYHLMEDAATAEISRTQIWSWVRYRAVLDNGRVVDPELFREVVDDELARVRTEAGEARMANGKFAEAKRLFESLCLSEELTPFLATLAYELI